MSSKRCFLCGIKLDKENETEEHVFPRWLLKRFNLYNSQMYFLNGRPVAYGKMKVPCCYKHNQLLKKKLEDILSKAKSYQEVIRLPRKIIFNWLIKIFLGIQNREKETLLKPGSSSKRKMLPKSFTDNYHTLMDFLTLFIKGRTIYKKPYPYSIFIYHINEDDNNFEKFFFADNIFSAAIAIRFADVGIVAILGDAGAQQDALKGFYNKIRRRVIHPQQFNEIIARHFYYSKLFNRTTKYMSLQSKDKTYILTLPIQGFSNKPVFDEWKAEGYNVFLQKYCQIDLEGIPHGKTITFLFDEKGKFKVL